MYKNDKQNIRQTSHSLADSHYICSSTTRMQNIIKVWNTEILLFYIVIILPKPSMNKSLYNSQQLLLDYSVWG